MIWAYDNAESMKDFDTGIIRIKTNKYEKDKKIKRKMVLQKKKEFQYLRII